MAEFSGKTPPGFNQPLEEECQEFLKLYDPVFPSLRLAVK